MAFSYPGIEFEMILAHCMDYVCGNTGKTNRNNPHGLRPWDGEPCNKLGARMSIVIFVTLSELV